MAAHVDQFQILAHATGFTLWRAEVREIQEAAAPGWLADMDIIYPGDAIIITGPPGQVAMVSVDRDRRLIPSVSILGRL